MNKSLFKNEPLLKIIFNSLIKLPTPVNISIWWNMGSILGLLLMIQIISGLFLSMHYCNNTNYAFFSIIHIIQDVNSGWLIRLIHLNGASFYFMSMYFHIGRGIYYESYLLIKPWFMGITIFMMSMATAFMGYVLPWGQMSFWGATVITNLVSTIPLLGETLVQWIWGGFSVSNPTLNRFFSLHFILPFLILLLVMIHLMFIHETGSTNPMGLNSDLFKIPFNNYFTLKDLIGFIIIMFLMIFIIMINPYFISDPENFMMANSMITPIHIQPEWYFLFAYTILRSIPNKLGGVLGLLMSIMILFIMPFTSMNKFKSNKFYPINQILFWLFTNVVILLTWLGTQPVEPPFIKLSQIMTILYFMFYFLNPMISKKWDDMIYN